MGLSVGFSRPHKYLQGRDLCVVCGCNCLIYKRLKQHVRAVFVICSIYPVNPGSASSVGLLPIDCLGLLPIDCLGLLPIDCLGLWPLNGLGALPVGLAGVRACHPQSSGPPVLCRLCVVCCVPGAFLLPCSWGFAALLVVGRPRLGMWAIPFFL